MTPNLPLSPSRVSLMLRRSIAMAGALVIALAAQAQAITIGDQFVFTADELLRNGLPHPVPGVATALVTLGARNGSSDLFAVNGFVLDVTLLSKTDCLTCSVSNLSLSGLQFDSATLGLTGAVTGQFPGSHGGTHYLEPYPLTPVPLLFLGQNGGLFFADIAAGLSTGQWNILDLHVGAGGGTDIRTASGTYAPLRPAVPEPSSLSLLGSGLAGLGGAALRWRPKKVA
jgi:PEP-CTERM motif-containing protein